VLEEEGVEALLAALFAPESDAAEGEQVRLLTPSCLPCPPPAPAGAFASAGKPLRPSNAPWLLALVPFVQAWVKAAPACSICWTWQRAGCRPNRSWLGTRTPRRAACCRWVWHFVCFNVMNWLPHAHPEARRMLQVCTSDCGLRVHMLRVSTRAVGLKRKALLCMHPA